jgi:hypothetical protein
MWMLIEGAYLYSRFTVIGMRSDAPTKAYLFAGWGKNGPILFSLKMAFSWGISS